MTHRGENSVNINILMREVLPLANMIFKTDIANVINILKYFLENTNLMKKKIEYITKITRWNF